MKKLYKKSRSILALLKFYRYDIRRYYSHFNYINNKDTIDKIKGELSMNYHVIEKGLTMPEPRLGFGLNQIEVLLNLLETYSKDFTLEDMEFEYSLKVLNEYLVFHKENNFIVDKEIVKRIGLLTLQKGVDSQSNQLEFTEREFFDKSNSSFDKFALSRHSVRNYISKEIPNEVISKCVEEAQKSPSSCNRQPIRVYAIKDDIKKEKILQLQNGNRGFGHLASTVFVITSNLSLFQTFPERHEPSLNAGMFAMSFLLALHHKRIGACSLNWCVSNQNDLALRKLLSIPDYEQVHLIISSGYLPDNFKVASSPRQAVEKVLKIII